LNIKKVVSCRRIRLKCIVESRRQVILVFLLISVYAKITHGVSVRGDSDVKDLIKTRRVFGDRHFVDAMVDLHCRFAYTLH